MNNEAARTKIVIGKATPLIFETKRASKVKIASGIMFAFNVIFREGFSIVIPEDAFFINDLLFCQA